MFSSSCIPWSPANHRVRRSEEIRIDNTLRGENGGDVSFKTGVAGQDQPRGADVPELPPSKVMEMANLPARVPMNRTTLLTMARTKPPEPLLEHEIRLRAFDLYDQRGRMDGHSVEYWLQAEAQVWKKPSHGAFENPGGVADKLKSPLNSRNFCESLSTTPQRSRKSFDSVKEKLHGTITHEVELKCGSR